MKIHAKIREGENYPIGHVFVRNAPEFLGSETALVGVHWLYKLFYWIRKTAYKEWTEQEISTVKLTLAIIKERTDRQYGEAYRAGEHAGEIHAVEMFKTMQRAGISLKVGKK